MAMIGRELKKSTVAEQKRAGRDKLQAVEKVSKPVQRRTAKLIQLKSKLIQLRANISTNVISPAQRPAGRNQLRDQLREQISRGYHIREKQFEHKCMRILYCFTSN
ncbi:hypothetical protein F511_32901 [Dorcoceras hygrometricum]|uniref:Uncharacterized protein n=1 Tax=Dorcoceras hygrometricum TaxID=472368 RepID=A0A2Z7DBP7_9LAMI|nr:hypothetical protein F511_32901 [Dorcoceras hygrometricum]